MNMWFDLLGETTFVLKRDKINILIIEEKNTYYKIGMELYNAYNRNPSTIVFSSENKPIDASSHIELLNQFIPVDICSKKLLVKINTMLNSIIQSDYYEEFFELSGKMQSFLSNVVFASDLPLTFDTIQSEQLLKSANIRIDIANENLCELIIDYCKTVRMIMGEKLFVFYGLLNFISCDELQQIEHSLLRNELYVLFVDNHIEEKRSECEEIIIIDKDLCVI